MMLDLHQREWSLSAPPSLRQSVPNGKLTEIMRRGENADLVTGFGGERNIGFVGEVINAGTKPEPSRLRSEAVGSTSCGRLPFDIKKFELEINQLQMTMLLQHTLRAVQR